MGFTESIKAAANKAATQMKENHVSITVTSGKNYLNMGAFSSSIIMRENADGFVYFDKVEGFFKIVDYQWDGPKYKTVATSNTVESSKGKDKTKKKGGLGGAAVGTLLMPGVGTVIGYAATRKKETTHSGGKESNTVVSEDMVETESPARITLRNMATGEEFSIGFQCNSTIDGELANFRMDLRKATAGEVSQQKSNVELLKEYKDLLDAQIITQDEFDQKKRELLSL